MKKLDDTQSAEAVDMYVSGLSLESIGKKFDVSLETIRNRVILAGVDRRSRARTRKTKNESFFKSIDCESKAYFLGLLIADGNVSKNYVRLSLVESDRHIIDSFANELESTNKIHTRVRRDGNSRNQACFTFNSQEIVGDLAALGVSDRKSFTVVPPKIDNHLRKHMIRGMIDGDGCLSVSKRGEIRVILVGSHGTCNYFADWVNELFGHRPSVMKSKNIYRANVCGDQLVGQVIAELYIGAKFKLSRKAAIAERILSGVEVNGKPTIAPQSTRKLYPLVLEHGLEA